MKPNGPSLEALFEKARLIPETGLVAPYGFGTRVADLGLEARREQNRSSLAWRLAWVSLLPVVACLTFVMLSQGSIDELWMADASMPELEEELFLP